MSVRIRVYPQNGALGMNRLGGQGAVSASTYFNSRLQTQKQVSSLQLGYERALWGERLDKVRLEERLKNPYAAMQTGVAGAYGGVPLAGYGGLPLGGYGAGLPVGGLPIGGFPVGHQQFGGFPIGNQQFGGIPGGFPGSGQSNVTNQTSTGAGNQSVSNSNVLNMSHQVTNPYGNPGFGAPPQFGGGGFLSGLLGALI